MGAGRARVNELGELGLWLFTIFLSDFNWFVEGVEYAGISARKTDSVKN